MVRRVWRCCLGVVSLAQMEVFASTYPDDTAALLQTSSRAQPHEAQTMPIASFQSVLKTVESMRVAQEASLDRMSKLLDVGAVAAAMTEHDGPDSAFDDWNEIYNPATMLNIQDNFHVAMRQVPLSLAQEGNMVIEQSNMTTQMRSHIKSAFKSAVQSARGNVAMQHYVVEDILPKLAALMGKNNLWRQMQDAARALETDTAIDVSHSPDLVPAFKMFPGLTKTGWSAVRQEHLLDRRHIKRYGAISNMTKYDPEDSESDNLPPPSPFAPPPSAPLPPPGPPSVLDVVSDEESDSDVYATADATYEDADEPEREAEKYGASGEDDYLPLPPPGPPPVLDGVSDEESTAYEESAYEDADEDAKSDGASGEDDDLAAPGDADSAAGGAPDPAPSNYGKGLLYLSEQGVELYQPDVIGVGAWFAVGIGGDFRDGPSGLGVSFLAAIYGIMLNGWKLQAHIEIESKPLCKKSGKVTTDKFSGVTVIFMAAGGGPKTGSPQALKVRYTQFNGLGLQLVRTNIKKIWKIKGRLLFPYQVPVKGLGSEWFLGIRPMVGVAKGKMTAWFSTQWALLPYPGLSAGALPQFRLHLNFDASVC